MFVIDCRDIKSILNDECEDIIQFVLDQVGHHAFKYLAPKIQNDVADIRRDLAQKANDSRELLALETM